MQTWVYIEKLLKLAMFIVYYSKLKVKVDIVSVTWLKSLI